MPHAKVLVVDQDQGPYEVLKQGLVRHGYEMHTTPTMARALDLAGAHAYKVAFVSLALVTERTLLDGLHAEIPDLPLILLHPPDGAHCIPPQILEVATYAVGTPLALGPLCLLLDRTMEMATLRAQVRQHRQLWCLVDDAASPAEACTDPPDVPLVRLEEALIRRLRGLIPSLQLLGRGSLHRVVLSYVEKLLLSVVLHECHGNQVKAAALLGINRNTLRKKLHDLEISSPSVTVHK
ncbi:MAG: helix-turn-helix domain-containing protein [Candidatus Tectimicrobiota bacterium]